MNILFFLHPKAELAFIYDYHTVRQAMEIMEHYKYSCVPILNLSLIHISEPTRPLYISYAVFCLKKIFF